MCDATIEAMPKLTFTLNGEKCGVAYEEGQNLLDVLREGCGVVSAKDGCSGEGVCGCCAVLVDGRPKLSCKQHPAKIEGQEITTLEGFSVEERELLATAFVREGAAQCGFCTPGIAVRAKSVIDKGQGCDRAAVGKALSGHICRCTGYARIFDAFASAQALRDGEVLPQGPRTSCFFGPGGSEPPEAGVGASALNYQGRAKVMGEKLFVADMRVEGMLHGAVVLSPHPRALLQGIDTSAALALPGVHRVFTADDVPGDRYIGLIAKDWPAFTAVGEETRCVGDVVAFVVADTQHLAHRAADLVELRVQELEPVTSPQAALEPGAHQVHESGNLLSTCAFTRGDVDEALAGAVHTLDERFTTQRIEHAFLEPEAALAVPMETGVKVYTQGQGVHDDQRQVADLLGLHKDQVHVELVCNGGAFGGKEDMSIQGQTSLAAFLMGRPVRTVLTRAQSLLMHPKRHPLWMHYRIGADAEGRLLGARVRMIGDTGAYASVGAKVLERAAGHSMGPYRVPAVDVEALAVYTNNPPCGAMRGFGANQAAFAIEGLLDRLAERVGVDGYEIRKRNILSPGDRFATGQLMNESVLGLHRSLEACEAAYRSADYAGIACGIKNTGIGNGMPDMGRVEVEVLADGKLMVRTGYTEMGQGLFTILRQVVAQETGLDAEDMEVTTVSEEAVLCGMTTASRATALATRAGCRAGEKLAAAMAESGLDALVGQRFQGEYVNHSTTKPDADVAEPVTHMAFSFATQVVVLDEDGHLEKVVAAHDVGRAINPLQCAGQIEGGVHMGLGYALSEDFPCTGGHPDSLRLREVGIIPAKHTPPVEVILIEQPDESGGYGSKGVGEIGLVPTAGAVAEALYRFDGKRRSQLPMVDGAAAEGFVPKVRRPR